MVGGRGWLLRAGSNRSFNRRGGGMAFHGPVHARSGHLGGRPPTYSQD